MYEDRLEDKRIHYLCRVRQCYHILIDSVWWHSPHSRYSERREMVRRVLLKGRVLCSIHPNRMSCTWQSRMAPLTFGNNQPPCKENTYWFGYKSIDRREKKGRRGRTLRVVGNPVVMHKFVGEEGTTAITGTSSFILPAIQQDWKNCI